MISNHSDHFLSGTLDYVPKNMSEVTFAPNETVKTVQVTIVDDNTTEPQEMFSGRLTAMSPVVEIGQGEVDVVIVDDDSELYMLCVSNGDKLLKDNLFAR